MNKQVEEKGSLKKFNRISTLLPDNWAIHF